jgi:hypothetical protein
MTGRDDLPDEFLDLVDGYCAGRLDDRSLRALESYLLASPEARRAFVAYFQMHAELEFAVRARNAASAALEQVAGGMASYGGDEPGSVGPPGRARRPRASGRVRMSRWSAVAASLLIAVAGYFVGQFGPGRSPARPAPNGSGPAAGRPAGANVAWLVNAQDCAWAGAESEMPGRDMRAGKVLRLRRGLAEIEFDRGARLILQGPAGLELLSGNEARLLSGSLTARVPQRARGFTVYSPRGKVVDLGTEFGLSVDESGATAVRVFAGKVEASPIAGGEAAAPGVTLHEDQSARIDDRSVALRPRGAGRDDTRYVRAIVPPPVVTPRALTLDFTRPFEGTLPDAAGQGVGLTHRLPGTGAGLPRLDANLRLNPRRGALELTTTRSDINTQQGMATGEYLGIRLSDLGFTGTEDFAVSATIPEIPGLASVGQFGLYAGARSDRNIRGGLISQAEPDRYLVFLVNNDGGRDSDLYEVGLFSTGDDLRLTLRRTAGAYSLVVENLTRPSSSTLSIAHPTFLDGERDLYVGLFGANTQSDMRKTLTIKEFGAKVWTVSPPPPASPALAAE